MRRTTSTTGKLFGTANHGLEQPAWMSGANISSAHSHNQRVILETVRVHGPLSRAEISARTALSSQTISNIVDKLLLRGTLQTQGRRSGRRGQPAVELDINPQGGYAIGLHLDRDHLTGVLLDLSGRMHHVRHHEWNYPTPLEALPILVETVQELTRLQGLSREDLWGIGVGLPGPLDLLADNTIDPPNFPGWNQVPLRGLLSQELNLPVYLETDATAAAVGERWFGRGREYQDYFYVLFGMGLGGGMILDGKPYRGGGRNAAMFGHLPVDAQGARCGCGGIGCLELFVSLASLYAYLRDHGRLVDQVDELATLLEQQDPILLAWMEHAVLHLQTALVTIENLLSPTAVIFGGRLPPTLIDWLLRALEGQLPQRQMRALRQHPRLLRAQASEDAAALGAATLPLFETFTPGHAIFA